MPKFDKNRIKIQNCISIWLITIEEITLNKMLANNLSVYLKTEYISGKIEHNIRKLMNPLNLVQQKVKKKSIFYQ